VVHCAYTFAVAASSSTRVYEEIVLSGEEVEFSDLPCSINANLLNLFAFITVHTWNLVSKHTMVSKEVTNMGSVAYPAVRGANTARLN
jgi:hypothetical protein